MPCPSVDFFSMLGQQGQCRASMPEQLTLTGSCQEEALVNRGVGGTCCRVRHSSLGPLWFHLPLTLLSLNLTLCLLLRMLLLVHCPRLFINDRGKSSREACRARFATKTLTYFCFTRRCSGSSWDASMITSSCLVASWHAGFASMLRCYGLPDAKQE